MLAAESATSVSPELPTAKRASAESKVYRSPLVVRGEAEVAVLKKIAALALTKYKVPESYCPNTSVALLLTVAVPAVIVAAPAPRF